MPRTPQTIPSPVVGLVASVLVTDGSSVTRGETVVLLESMKMELPVDAPAPGVVSTFFVDEGAHVAEGDALFVLEIRLRSAAT